MAGESAAVERPQTVKIAGSAADVRASVLTRSAIVILFSVFFTSSCTQFVRSVAAGADKKNCLVLAGSTTRETEGVTRIVGSVRNDCRRRFGNVTVAFRLYRSERFSRANLPEAVIAGYVRDLEPGQTEDFETLPVGRGAGYRLERISGY
jgi:hypothetical protein